MKSFVGIVAGGLILCSQTILAKEFIIDQKDKAFIVNGKLADSYSVKVGDKINFRNMDPWFHNIFSLSDIKTFDLGSYPQGEARPVVFDKVGRVEIECAIHPQMFIEVDVTD
ncbi:MAG: methylamine utilization protein [Gammaproteobacteria bacterium]|nr:methylamine utilization protein [Gammaproteobacteria bacterium]